MKILVLGGTRFFGIPMVHDLIAKQHDITIATRGNKKDDFGDKVKRIALNRYDAESMKQALSEIHYDVVIDKIAYASNDIKILLDVIDCDRYLYMSSMAVYDSLHLNVNEEEFNTNGPLIWCDRKDGTYAEVKRQAEYALWSLEHPKQTVAVRYPYVIGKDDYTNRLQFYVEHVVNDIPMYIDNMDCQMSFINSKEAGRFLAFLVESGFTGAINGCSYGTISIGQILDYVQKKTGKKAIISTDGDPAPYNVTKEYSLNLDKAKAIGFQFTNLTDWIYDLLDYYINYDTPS